MTKTTPLLLTTHTLSQAMDAIVAAQHANPRPLDKGRMLHALARVIAGPKHNWGFLTGQDGLYVARDAQRFAASLAPDTLFFYQFDERDNWGRGLVGPFRSRAQLLHALAADTWWHTPQLSVAEVINTLATHDDIVIRPDEDDDASPYAITIFTVAIPAPQADVDLPVVGWRIEDVANQASDQLPPPSVSLFPTQEAAQAFLDATTPPNTNLRVRPVHAGAIPHPVWL